MRLYLSSYKFGNHIDALKSLASDVEKVAIIMNALDFGDPERVAESVEKTKDKLAELGLKSEQLDLRQYFSHRSELEKKLQEYQMVWVAGGNSFILKRAFEQSGFDKILNKRLAEDSLVYAGFSAAVAVVTPTLRGVELVDDPNVVPDHYQDQFSWDGLGLLDYSVAVHYRSDHPESDDVEKEVAYYEENQMPYQTLRDGEVIVMNGDKEEILTSRS